MVKKKQPVNRGVLLGRKPNDWIAGVNSKIPYEVRLPSGDWTPYANQIRKEKQHNANFTTDTLACVSFSANNVCEMQILHQTGIEANLSDRFLAKMSGTTHQGNWLYIVADTIRNIGVVNEAEWPVPPNPNFTWDDYYTPIPQFIIDRAKPQFKDKYTVQDEDLVWVNPGELRTLIEKHLKHAPLQMVLPGHAIGLIALKVTGDKVSYMDSYDPFIKETDMVNIQSLKKIVLTVKKGTPKMEVFQVEGEATLVLKNFAGRYLEIATSPEQYPVVAKVLGLGAVPQPFPKVSRAEVEANKEGRAQSAVSFFSI